MFPFTKIIDGQIADLKSRGLTPKRSEILRGLMIEQAAAWFPGKEKSKLAEEHLIERGIIPAKFKKE